MTHCTLIMIISAWVCGCVCMHNAQEHALKGIPLIVARLQRFLTTFKTHRQTMQRHYEHYLGGNDDDDDMSDAAVDT